MMAELSNFKMLMADMVQEVSEKLKLFMKVLSSGRSFSIAARLKLAVSHSAISMRAVFIYTSFQTRLYHAKKGVFDSGWTSCFHSE